MEGLVIVVFIIIGILNFAQKQNQNQRKGQGGMKKQPGIKRQNPQQQWRSNPMQPIRTAIDMEDGMPLPIMMDESEGIESEDRNRTGSLDYIEQSYSSEGVCDEHPEHAQEKSKDMIKTTTSYDLRSSDEDQLEFGISAADLMRSVVMAEVLGSPRSIKRSIR